MLMFIEFNFLFSFCAKLFKSPIVVHSKIIDLWFSGRHSVGGWCVGGRPQGCMGSLTEAWTAAPRSLRKAALQALPLKCLKVGVFKRKSTNLSLACKLSELFYHPK